MPSLLQVQRTAGNAAAVLLAKTVQRQDAEQQPREPDGNGGGGGGLELPPIQEPQGPWITMKGQIADAGSLQALARGEEEVTYSPDPVSLTRTSPPASHD